MRLGLPRKAASVSLVVIERKLPSQRLEPLAPRPPSAGSTPRASSTTDSHGCAPPVIEQQLLVYWNEALGRAQKLLDAEA